jgi:hypothetical protein
MISVYENFARAANVHRLVRTKVHRFWWGDEAGGETGSHASARRPAELASRRWIDM